MAVPSERPRRGAQAGAPGWLVVAHRYLGVAMGLLMLVWFLSGVVMLFAHWPEVTERERTAALAPIDWSRCCDLGPASRDVEVVDAATLEQVGDRPVLRRGGETLDLTAGTAGRFTEADAVAAAEAFAGAPAEAVTPVTRDQWTVTGYFNRHRPMWRVTTGDGAQVYVAQASGRVVQATTPAERFWAWLGPIPHWLYPQVLRQDVGLWTQVVVWTSVAGLILTVTGLWLGIAAWRRAPAGRISPYRGIMDWHHVTSVFTGLLTLSWVLSGLLSMQPWGLLESGPDDAAARIAGEPVTYGQLRTALAVLAAERPRVRQVRAAPFDGRLYLIADGRRLDATGRDAPLTAAELARAGRALGGVRQVLIARGDAYHYAHHEPVVLPAWRVVRADGVRHYLDPGTGELLATVDRPAQGFRWGHLALHRLDVVPANPGWAAAMVVLLLACMAGVATGVWLGVRRIRHDFWRLTR